MNPTAAVTVHETNIVIAQTGKLSSITFTILDLLIDMKLSL